VLGTAQPGDVLVLEAGDHPGPFVVDQPQVLIGAPGARLLGGPGVDVITANADLVLADLLIEASQDGGRAIRITAGDARLDRLQIFGLPAQAPPGTPVATGGLVDVSAGASLEIVDSNVMGGAAGMVGGLVHALGSVDLHFCRLSGGQAPVGAAVAAIDVRITDSEVLGNGSTSMGAVATPPTVDCATSTCAIEVRSSRFMGNQAPGGLGASIAVGRTLDTSTYALDVSDSSFMNGNAQRGGAIAILSPATTRIDRTRFCLNLAVNRGAAVYVDAPGDHSWQHLLFHGNQGPQNAALSVDDGLVELGFSTFWQNVPDTAIWTMSTGTVAFDHVLIAGHAGTAVRAEGAPPTTYAWTAFDGNGTNAVPAPTGTVLFDVAPGFVSGPDCIGSAPFEPALTSPAVDGGDPSRPEADGTDPDIGASGGDPEPCPLLQGWRDLDADGLGDANKPYVGCVLPASYADNLDDCDDLSPSAGALITGFADADLDGVGFGPAEPFCGALPVGFAAIDGDCDDDEPLVNPNRVEVTCNGLDDDCDPSSADPVDADGDSFPCDCDEADETVFPGAEESCDGVDEDCDAAIDEGFPVTDWWPDLDGDGHGAGDPIQACAAPPQSATTNTDCDDDDELVNPDEPELCNGVDDDCDESTDEGLPTSDGYPDADGDGFGDLSAPSTPSCATPPGMVADHTDCDDNDPLAHPGLPEDTDSARDADCDGYTDPTGPLRSTCGCSGAGPFTSGWLVAGVLLLARRRTNTDQGIGRSTIRP
jgi:hypothetical protein